jgi:hypothetical protein
MNMGIIAASRLRDGPRNSMFGNAVAYYRLDETTGDAIDLVNSYNGTLNGSIGRNGEYYTFDAENEYVEIADEDDFSFTDGAGNNTDFVIKTEVIFEDFNSFANRAWLVSKRQQNVTDIREWQFYYFEGEIQFRIYDSSDNFTSFAFSFTPTIGQKYILGVTLNGTTISLFIDGVIGESDTLPVGFTFFNGPSEVKLGDETFTEDLNLIGKLKETVIVKGNGWTKQNIIDNYNGGAGITYNL